MNRFFLWVCMLLICEANALFGQVQYGIVSWKITSSGSTEATPCNVRLLDADGNSYRPRQDTAWKDFTGKPFEEFLSTGEFSIRLPWGDYYYEIDKGHEYAVLRGHFSVSTVSLHLDMHMQRIADMRSMGWWSADLHIHRNPADIELLMRASDLYVAPVITSWNGDIRLPAASGKESPVYQFDSDRYYSLTASEDERAGGALLFFNLSQPLDIPPDNEDEYPPLAASVSLARNSDQDVWIDLEKPFWWDTPLLLASGKINSIGIANNHMCKNGVFDTEARGRSRDRGKYPSPLGNAYWSQDIYYHILNSGFRIPPSAGSASGVLWNPAGYNRVYAYTGREFTHERWWEALAAGRSFVTNGPLVICKANNQYPGYVFSSEEGSELKIRVEAQLFGERPLKAVQIIKNGVIIQEISGLLHLQKKLQTEVSFRKSGWFLMRVLEEGEDNFRFASTAPFYVEVGEKKKYISRKSICFFLDWIDERERMLKEQFDVLPEDIAGTISEAGRFWNNLLQQSDK